MGSALAALIGGFGQAAHQQHMQDAQLEAEDRRNLSSMITSMASRAMPEEIPSLIQMNADIYGSKKPIYKSEVPGNIMRTALAMQRSRMNGGTPGVGTQFPPSQPAAPGQTASAFTPLDSMISGLPGATQGIMPSAPDLQPTAMPGAQPGTSPVQPARQGGGSSPLATFRTPGSGSLPEPISGVPASGGAGGTQPVPDQANGFDQFRQLALHTDPAYLPILEHALTTYTAPYISNAAELQRQRDLANFQLKELGPEKVGMLRNLPGYQNLPPIMQGMSEAEALGIPMHMPMGMMTPIHMNGISATTLEAQHPGILQQMGIDPAKTPLVDVTFDKMTNAPVQVQGKPVPMRFVPGWNGQLEAVNPYAVDQGTTEVAGGAAPATAATTRTGTSLGFENVNGQIVPINKPTSQTSQKVPGGNIGTPPVGGGNGGAAHSNGIIPPVHGNGAVGGVPTVHTGTPLGDSQSTFHMRAENQLTPAGQTIVTQGQTVLGQVDQALSMLQGKKDDNTPGWASSQGLSKALYRVGISDDNSKLINSIELQRLMEAGQLLKTTGGSRAIQVLDAALVHTPGTLNSPKLMYEKLQNIRQYLVGAMDAAKQNMQRYPGLPPVGSGTSGGMVTMRAPDGTTKQVSAAAVDHYKSLGASVVQ